MEFQEMSFKLVNFNGKLVSLSINLINVGKGPGSPPPCHSFVQVQDCSLTFSLCLL